MRTLEKVETDLQKSLLRTNPTLDVNLGGPYDIMIRPLASEIQSLERQMDHISRLYSLDYLSAASYQDMIAMATNFGMSVDPGKPAQGVVVFQRFTRPDPNDTLVIPIGTLVSTQDGLYVFRTTETRSLTGANAAAYYNPTAGAWEIYASVEAVSVGEEYNVPAFRVNKIQTPIHSFTRVENRDSFTSGTTAESRERLYMRVKIRLQGMDTGKIGGFASSVINSNPNIKDVVVVQPKDRNLWYRSTSTPALDIYITGESIASTTYEYTAFGGETKIKLPNSAVRSVDAVSVGGVSVTYRFLPDTSLAHQHSALSADFVELSTPLHVDETCSIAYSYNRLLMDVQDTQLAETESSLNLFGTSVLLRESVKAYLNVKCDVRIFQGFDANTVEFYVTQYILLTCNPQSFLSMLQPEILRQQIRADVAGVQNVNFTSFTRIQYGLAEVEPLSFLLNEEPVLLGSNLTVRIIR